MLSLVATAAFAGTNCVPATRAGPATAGSAASGGQGRVLTGEYRGPEGARPWRLYVPGAYAERKPLMLVVLLHGCLQDAADIARGSRMDVVAEAEGFLVLYPEQVVEANPRRCWNWYDPAHQRAGSGEPALIAAMTRQVVEQYGADPQRVHVAGISAGAAMASFVAIGHPAQFAAVAMHSGVAFGAAKDVPQALAAMQRGGGDNASTPREMLEAMGARGRAIPAIVLHGERDNVTVSRNGEESVAQWVGMLEALQQQSGGPSPVVHPPVHTVEGGYQVRRQRWSQGGRAMVQSVMIAELGHAWSGGSPDGTFTDSNGPDASREIAAFFAQHRLPSGER
jgi:poly(hydroxyalkanoate) depolymerase family esterase